MRANHFFSPVSDEGELRAVQVRHFRGLTYTLPSEDNDFVLVIAGTFLLQSGSPTRDGISYDQVLLPEKIAYMASHALMCFVFCGLCPPRTGRGEGGWMPCRSNCSHSDMSGVLVDRTAA